MIINQQAINNAVEITPYLFQIDNFFDPATLDQIVDNISKQTNWKSQELQTELPRLSLQWKTDDILDHLWSVLSELDYSRFGLKFNTVMIWKDSAGYCIKDHVDNDNVKAAILLYLVPGPIDIGTWFGDIEIPFRANTGFLMLNETKPVHGMRVPVPENFTRYSMYALFDYV